MSVHTDDVIIANTPLPVDGSGVTQPVSGTVTANAGTGTFTVDGSGHTQPVSGTVTATQATGSNLHVVVDSGTITTTSGTSNTATITQTTSNSANQTLLASNANRKKAIMFFATGTWYVKFGTTASATSFTYNVTTSNTTIEVPVWTGQIDALCTTSGKVATITEMV